ncbi:HRDC domain-containing protein [uncultured Nocardioides sp.]|uniref:HRDC domain-containing protein n=1 Tax=uncultured Nocardioides sp. TaxID=198441 RepID=UPI0026285B33|nr:HRDC domain-containing protein [uncultured Nocardioides sp.]
MALGHQDHSAQDSPPVPTGDLLTEIRDLDQAADQADRDRFIAIAEWADRHTTGQLLPDLYGTFGLPDDDAHTEAENAWVSRFGMPGADTMLELAGPGAPEISEFAVVELAAALGRSTDSGRMLLSDAVEARYRLPKVWQRLVDGQVQVWRVRRVTDLTRSLTAEAAAFVDAHLAHAIHTASFTSVKRLVAEAAARFDPETTEMEEVDTAATLHVTLDLTTAWSIGTANGVHLSGLLDRADVKAQLKALGRSDSPVADRMADLRTVELSADTGDDPERDTGRAAAFAEIRRMADEFLSLDPGGTGRGFVAWVWSQGRAMADDSTDAVEVSTFHAAKGLEWPIVHVAGLEQGLVPIGHARDAGARAEERRLLYVALTGAEDRLFLTWAARRSFGTRSSTRTPSMWLPDLEAAIAGLDRPLGRAEGARRVAAIRERTSRAALPDHPVVTALRDYRSTAARAANVPPYVVFNDATLIDLITTWPSTVGELLGITGIGPTKADRHGAAILAILAVNDRPDPPPVTKAPSEPAPVTAASFDPDDVDGPGGPVYEALRAWRSEVSRSAGIPAYRVLNNRTLDALVELRPADLEGLLEVPGIGPRTVETYGEAILMAITGAG